MGVGALLIFFGVALLAARIARPLAGVLGIPSRRMGGVAGRLARENAQRNPQRTASTASALMIGLALVTLVAILAAGITSTFTNAVERPLERRRLRDHGAEQLLAAPGLGRRRGRGVAGRGGRGQRPHRRGPGVRRHDLRHRRRTRRPSRCSTSTGRRGRTRCSAQLGADGAFVDENYADDHDLRVGSPIDLTFANGETEQFTIDGHLRARRPAARRSATSRSRRRPGTSTTRSRATSTRSCAPRAARPTRTPPRSSRR